MKKIAVPKPILVGLTVLLVVAGVTAGPSIRKTKITFSGPVRVPGATLSAGTYYFSAPLPNNRSLVRIMDENGKYVTQFMGLLDYPRKPVRDLIAFGDHDCGPKAIKAWSYPPSGSAVRFVYAQDEAASIAAACNEPVPETHESTLNESGLETYGIYLMTPEKQEEPYKPELLSSSDQRDQNGFDALATE